MSHHFFFVSVCLFCLSVSVCLPACLPFCLSVYLLLLLVPVTKTMLSVPASPKMKIIFCSLVTSVLTTKLVRKCTDQQARTPNTFCQRIAGIVYMKAAMYIFLGFKAQLRTHKKFKQTLFIRAKTQSAKFRGNPLRQDTR